MDIGVHKDLDIKQREYCFDICFQDDGASLLMNTAEQILTEKLKSFLRFGVRSTRYKDVFDIYFLVNNVDYDLLMQCVDRYIFSDESLSVNTLQDISKRIERVFTNKIFIANLKQSEKNWLDIEDDVVLTNNINFVKSLVDRVTQ